MINDDKSYIQDSFNDRKVDLVPKPSNLNTMRKHHLSNKKYKITSEIILVRQIHITIILKKQLMKFKLH